MPCENNYTLALPVYSTFYFSESDPAGLTSQKTELPL